MISVFILAITLSLDAFSVGMVYAIKGVRIPFLSKLNICFFSIIYSMLALMLGKNLNIILHPTIAKYIGVVLLLFMGAWIIVQSLKDKHDLTKSDVFPDTNWGSKEKTLFKFAVKSLGITIQVTRDPLLFDLDHSGTISAVEALMLGLALSVDAIGVSFGSALVGLYSLYIPIIIGLFQLSFIYLGNFFGKKLATFCPFNEKILSLLPGILLICLALAKI